MAVTLDPSTKPQGLEDGQASDGQSLEALEQLRERIELEPGLAITTIQDHQGRPKLFVHHQRKRVPNLELRRQRLELRDRLVNELSHLRLWLAKQKQPLAPGALQQQFPSFKLWDLLTPDEVAELAAGEKFLPRAYADNLVLRKYGLTSRETLRKDRQMLRRYERRQAAFGAH